MLLISQLSIGDGSQSDRVIFCIDEEMKQGLLQLEKQLSLHKRKQNDFQGKISTVLESPREKSIKGMNTLHPDERFFDSFFNECNLRRKVYMKAACSISALSRWQTRWTRDISNTIQCKLIKTVFLLLFLLDYCKLL